MDLNGSSNTSTHPHPIVSLKSLRLGNPKTVAITSATLRRDGFIFLNFNDDPLLYHYATTLPQISSYLQKHRSRGQDPTTILTGHISNRYKDSISLITGNQIHSCTSNLPSALPIHDIQSLCTALDEASTEVVAALAHPLFGLSSGEVVDQSGQVFDIPLLDAKAEKKFGMVDIVCYHNDEDVSKKSERKESADMVVADHVDPGLLILSLPQSSPGLELLKLRYDGGVRELGGDWISPPPGCGVLWAGKRASENGLCRPGVHRVKKGAMPRISCWHELCTSSQFSEPLLDKLTENGEELVMGDLQGTEEVVKILRKAEEHDMDAVNFVKFEQISNGGGIPILKVETGRFQVSIVKAKKRSKGEQGLFNTAKKHLRMLSTSSSSKS